MKLTNHELAYFLLGIAEVNYVGMHPLKKRELALKVVGWLESEEEDGIGTCDVTVKDNNSGERLKQLCPSCGSYRLGLLNKVGRQEYYCYQCKWSGY